jgi:hypothetical protein
LRSALGDSWTIVRGRMWPRLDALLQELGAEAADRERCINRMLDEVVREEFLALLGERWTVWRQDDNGNRFVVESGLARDGAHAMAFELQERGHKQVYWCTPGEP